MSRRSPAALRATSSPARNSRPVAVTGLSAATLRELRDRPCPDPASVGQALAQWRRAVHGPARSLTRGLVVNDCPCCDDRDQRDVLERAMAALSTRASRELRALVAPLDEILERRTCHDPQAPPDAPWWRRRL